MVKNSGMMYHWYLFYREMGMLPRFAYGRARRDAWDGAFWPAKRYYGVITDNWFDPLPGVADHVEHPESGQLHSIRMQQWMSEPLPEPRSK